MDRFSDLCEQKFFESAVNEFLSKFASMGTYIENYNSIQKQLKYTYGERLLTRYAKYLLNDRPDGVTYLILDMLVGSLKYKWEKLLEIMEVTYDPLKPFDITLNEDITDTLETVKDKSIYTEQDGTRGFNSTTSVPTDNSSNETNREYKRENPRTRDYTRKGNIGNTSFQDLIKQEREVANYKLRDILLMDIVSVFCRNVYQ